METDDLVLRQLPAKFRPIAVIIAGCVLQFTFGLIYTFGNLLPYLASYLRWKVDPQQTQGSLIWLQSLMSGLPFAMLAGGYMERWVGARWGAAFGSLLYTGAMALSYLSIQHSFLLLMLTLGLLSSFGQGLAYNCVLIQSQRWMPDRVGLASGLITAGFGSGAFVISPVQTKFINPDNLSVDRDGFFTQVELLERVPKLFLLLAAIFGSLQFVALFFIAAPKCLTEENENLVEDEEQSEQEEEENDVISNLPSNHNHRLAAGRNPLLPIDGRRRILPFRRRRRLSSSLASSSYGGSAPYEASQIHYSAPTLATRRILRSQTFCCLFLTLLFNGIWVQTLSGLFKAYGQTFISDDFFLATVNSFAAATNCLSRILWGMFADRFSYQSSMGIACALGAALMWSLGIVEKVDSPFLFLIWICAMFCCVGATYSLVPYATHKCFGSDNFGVAYGCIQFSIFISGIITALCSQFLLSLIGFNLLFTIIGFTMLFSFGLTVYLSRTEFGSPVAS